MNLGNTTSNLYPKETAILLVISKSAKSLAEIARLSNLPRSTVEYNLRRLLKKKYITVETVGKRKLFVRNSRVKIENTATSEPITQIGPITIYRGVKAMASLWHEISNMPKGSRLFGIQPRKSFDEAIRRSDKKDVYKITSRITNKRFIGDITIHEDGIKSVFNRFQDKEANKIAGAFTNRIEDAAKVDPTFLDEKAEWFSIGDSTVFMDWYSEIAIKITGTNINSFMKALHYAAKAYGERFNQGEYIKEIIKGKEAKK